MRYPYEPCREHGRPYCSDYGCKREEHGSSDNNSGNVSVNTEGHLAVGLGGGLAMDLTDGSIGMQVGGITIDIDGNP